MCFVWNENEILLFFFNSVQKSETTESSFSFSLLQEVNNDT